MVGGAWRLKVFICTLVCGAWKGDRVVGYIVRAISDAPRFLVRLCFILFWDLGLESG